MYRQLGFTIKPVRIHKNGIRNHPIKFRNGTEIAHITADESRDPLSAEYIRPLESGDGSVFVGFSTTELGDLALHFDDLGRTAKLAKGTLPFPESDTLRHIFFAERTTSPTDQPDHFNHPKGSEALIGVWIAGDDLEPECKLFTGTGAEMIEVAVNVPESLETVAARFQHAEVVFLPRAFQLVPERKVVGAVIQTRGSDTV
jgi:hypothetical protein